MPKYFPIKTATACQLKWTWSTLFLNDGTTSSCHRVGRHQVALEDFDNFHNTPIKIDQRNTMLEGKWPQPLPYMQDDEGCRYCQKIEEAGGQSDRMYHNQIPDLSPPELEYDPPATNVTPRILEVFLSNTCNLITNHNYEAILIEADKKKFNELNINFPDKKIIKINKFVNFSGENSLDNILENNSFNKDFDFLSIDIDGCDYWILESLLKFTPKIICIEFNPSIANKVAFIQEKNMKINQGSSAKSIIDLGLKKNYFPIASTDCNLFFVGIVFVGKNSV
jgi:hypothetical protein